MVEHADSGLLEPRRKARSLMKNPDLINELEAAELLGCSRRTLQSWRSERRGPPFVKLGNRRFSRVRYLRAELERWLTARTSQGEVRHVDP